MSSTALFFFYDCSSKQFGYFLNQNFNPLEPTIACETQRFVLKYKRNVVGTKIPAWIKLEKPPKLLNNNQLAKWYSSENTIACRIAGFKVEQSTIDWVHRTANAAATLWTYEKPKELFKDFAKTLELHFRVGVRMRTKEWLSVVNKKINEENAQDSKAKRVKPKKTKSTAVDGANNALSSLKVPTQVMPKQKGKTNKHVGFDMDQTVVIGESCGPFE